MAEKGRVIQMDLNQLKTFEVVINKGSFEKAAEESYVTQRSVSRQMKRLEDELNVKLFKRNANKISLTKAGEYFAIYVNSHLRNLDKTIQELQKIANNQEDRLRIAYSSAFEGELVRDLIKEFKVRSSEKIDFSIIQKSVEAIISDLNEQKIDLGLIPQYGLNHLLDLKLFKIKTIHTGQIKLMIAEKNELTKSNVISLDQLANQNLYFFSQINSSYLKNELLSNLQNKIGKINLIRANTIVDLVLQVQLNNGIALVPEDLFKQFMKVTGLVFKNLKTKATYKMQLVSLKSNNSKMVRTFFNNIE